MLDDPRYCWRLGPFTRGGAPSRGIAHAGILTAATRNGAEALRIIDKVGTIAEGKLPTSWFWTAIFCRTLDLHRRLQCSRRSSCTRNASERLMRRECDDLEAMTWLAADAGWHNRVTPRLNPGVRPE